jgi:hypothetical protein
VLRPSGIDAAPNALAIAGGAITSIDAEAVSPAPLSVDVTGPVALTWCPAEAAVTLTEIEHDEDTASVAPDRLTLPEPAAALAPPPHVLVRLGAEATWSPAGRLSVNPTPCSTVPELGFWIVNVSDVVPPSGIDVAPNACWMVGAPTLSVAVAVFPVPPFVEVTGPVVLVLSPSVVPWTVTDTVHDEPTPTVPPDRLTLELPDVAVAVPPHAFVTLGVPSTTTPDGRLSVKATPVSGSTFALGLVIVNVSVAPPFSAIVDGLKTLAIDGGEVAEAVAAKQRTQQKVLRAATAATRNRAVPPERASERQWPPSTFQL